MSEPLSVIREFIDRARRGVNSIQEAERADASLSDLERRMEGLEKALERIKDRAQRITDSRLECTVFSAASYDLEVATKALSQRTDVVTQKEER